MKRYVCNYKGEMIGRVVILSSNDGPDNEPNEKELSYMRRFLINIQKRKTLSETLQDRDRETRRKNSGNNRRG